VLDGTCSGLYSVEGFGPGFRVRHVESAMPKGNVDLTSILSAARNISPKEQAWWQDAYEDEDERTPFASSLDRLEREPPKKLDDILKLCGRGRPDDVQPWHLALLARASAVTTPAKIKLSAKAAFVVGSLHLRGPLQLKGPLVVTGDLTVDGPIIDVIEKWLLLAVGGSLKAHAVASSQHVLVGGDCTVRDFIWGFEAHCPFVVRGKVKAPLVVWTDHRPSKLGDASGVSEVLDNPDQADLERHFDAKLLGDCTIKQKAMVMRLVAGKPVGPK